jgi:YHS domain-containing protein
MVSLLTTLALASLATPAALAQQKLDWQRDLDAALEQAAEEGVVVFLSIGFVGETRSDRIRKQGFADKAVVAQAAATINVPAWTWALGDESKLPDFGEAEAVDHSANLARATSDWLGVNDLGTFATPQHLWLNGAGEVLLSVPWEMEPEELSWCFDEALRLAGVDARPATAKEARPPRRLLLKEVVALPADDDLGRGLTEDELESTMERLKRGFVSARDREDIGRIMFTPDEDGVEFLEQQFGLWDFGGSATAGIIDFSFGLIGYLGPMEYLELLETEIESARASLRSIVAVGYEQMGHPDGLKAVRKGLKKEEDEAVRPEWVRALGACAPRDKAVATALETEETVEFTNEAADVDAPAEATGEDLSQRTPINDVCLVSGKAIDPQFNLLHEGQVIGFCCPNCPAAFQAEPAKYLAKLPPASAKDGNAEDLSARTPVNAVCLVSGKAIDPQFNLLHEGQVIGFCCPNCPAAFQADPAKYLAKLEPGSDG